MLILLLALATLSVQCQPWKKFASSTESLKPVKCSGQRLVSMVSIDIQTSWPRCLPRRSISRSCSLGFSSSSLEDAGLFSALIYRCIYRSIHHAADDHLCADKKMWSQAPRCTPRFDCGQADSGATIGSCLKAASRR